MYDDGKWKKMYEDGKWKMHAGKWDTSHSFSHTLTLHSNTYHRTSYDSEYDDWR